MRFQKIVLYSLLATMAVGCGRFGGFTGCWGCDGFYGCDQWDLADDHFLRHESSGLPFGMFFSIQGLDPINPYGPSANGTTNSLALARFGIQHFLANNLALRVLLNFGTETEGPDSASSTRSVYGIGVGLAHYFRPLYNIAPYIGAGIGYNMTTNPGFTGSGDVVGSGQNPQGTGGVPGESTYNTFGVTAVAGFDWYLTQNIAIGSEYALGFSTTSGTFTPTGGESVDVAGPTTFGFAPAGNLHVLIHF